MTTISEANSRLIQLRRAVVWALIIVYLALVVGFAWDPTPFAQILAAIGIASAIGHAVLYYGWKDASLFRHLSRHHLRSRKYRRRSRSAVRQLLLRSRCRTSTYRKHSNHRWSAMVGIGYLSWIVAGTLLDGADRRMKVRFNVIALPIVAAFVMTQWDLVMDPPSSTIAKAWIWHDGGAYFGVPLLNYLGWLLTSWMFYQRSFCRVAAISRCPPNAKVAHSDLPPFCFTSAQDCHT